MADLGKFFCFKTLINISSEYSGSMALLPSSPHGGERTQWGRADLTALPSATSGENPAL